MSLQDLANLGEALGGLAVVVTLVYLAVQIRQNTRALRAATFQQVVDSFADISRSLSHDPGLCEILLKGREDPGSLDDLDRLRYSFFLLSFLRRGENLHFQYQQGALDPDAWTGIRESLLTTFRQPLARDWWKENRYRFNTTFQEFLDRDLS